MVSWTTCVCLALIEELVWIRASDVKAQLVQSIIIAKEVGNIPKSGL